MNKLQNFNSGLNHQYRRLLGLLAPVMLWLLFAAVPSSLGISDSSYDWNALSSQDTTRTVGNGMDIEIQLTWETPDNLDLILETPSGNLIWRKNKTEFGISMTRHSNDNVYTVEGLIDSLATRNNITQPSIETITWLNNADFERGEYTIHVLFDDRRTCGEDSLTTTYPEVVSELTINIKGEAHIKELRFENMLNDRCSNAYLSKYVYTMKSLRPALFAGKAKTAFKFFL